ncbi:MAG: hypothetical protein Fur0010_01320 [Bdellovibrio sp.]
MALLENVLKELKLDLAQFESQLQNIYPDECYVGQDLTPEALYTNEQDSVEIIRQLQLKDSDRVLDVGSGIGHFIIPAANEFPGVHFTGVELVKERIELAKKISKHLALKNTTWIAANLNQIDLPRADVYFFYFSTGKAFSKIMEQLLKESFAREFKIVAIESHGDLIQNFIDRPWLSLAKKIPIISKRHNHEAYVFTSIQNHYHSELMKNLKLIERDMNLKGFVDWKQKDRHHWEMVLKKDWYFESHHRSPKIEYLKCSECSFSTFDTLTTPQSPGDIPLNKIVKIVKDIPL